MNECFPLSPCGLVEYDSLLLLIRMQSTHLPSPAAVLLLSPERLTGLTGILVRPLSKGVELKDVVRLINPLSSLSLPSQGTAGTL